MIHLVQKIVSMKMITYMDPAWLIKRKPSVEKIIELDGTWKRSCVEGANKIYQEVGRKRLEISKEETLN